MSEAKMSASSNTPSTWIWYPGDFEIRLHEKTTLFRRARGGIYPPFWKIDRHYSNVNFRYHYELEQDEQIVITAQGNFASYIDHNDNYRSNLSRITLPKGKHTITVSVFNDIEIPAIYVEGATVHSSSEWEVTSFQKEWVPAGMWNFNSIDHKPADYRLEVKTVEPLTEEIENGYSLLDFGRETIGYLQFYHLSGDGEVRLFYGESREEALSMEHGVEIDSFDAEEARKMATENMYTLPLSKAFRYVQIQADSDVKWQHVNMLYEYTPVNYRGSFECSDSKLNHIWDTALYTLHLNTREFFLDGIKRDRWVWSGDAYQAFLMNYYSFFDLDVTKRTLVALRGKGVLTMHINTILDYSFYWFISLQDYYHYTGDVDFVRQNYNNAVSLMELCLSQRNEEGLVEGRPQDWTFIDWAQLPNEGAVSTEQILFIRSLEAMGEFAALLGEEQAAHNYRTLATEIRETTFTLFWNEEQGGLLHHRVDKVTQPVLTKHASMFALTYGYLSQDQQDQVVHNVLLNPEVPLIHTPYMRFHELAALCQSGEHQAVLQEVLSYWGGMLDLGATSFWETFEPAKQGLEHYSMYGVPFGKSLCHAWGATPVYLLGKYFLGVTPTSVGYLTYKIEPHLGGLAYMKGAVPMDNGDVFIEMDTDNIQVRSTFGEGTLVFTSTIPPTCSSGTITQADNGKYKLIIEPNHSYSITYHCQAE